MYIYIQDLFYDDSLWRSTFEIGNIVDVMDNTNRWYIAKILKLSSDYVWVTFYGWSSKFDERLSVDSKRILPFCSRSSLDSRRENDYSFDITEALKGLKENSTRYVIYIYFKFIINNSNITISCTVTQIFIKVVRIWINFRKMKYNIYVQNSIYIVQVKVVWYRMI